jgi:hypothetical protein
VPLVPVASHVNPDGHSALLVLHSVAQRMPSSPKGSALQTPTSHGASPVPQAAPSPPGVPGAGSHCPAALQAMSLPQSLSIVQTGASGNLPALHAARTSATSAHFDITGERTAPPPRSVGA